MNKEIWNINNKDRNFLARVIGTFGEDITKIWLENKESQYEYLGRPTIYWTEKGSKKHSTLDFLIKEKNIEGYFIVEQKNLFAYKNGTLKTIDESVEFIKNYNSWNESKLGGTLAWKIFNNLKDPDFDFYVKSNLNKESKIHKSEIVGAILIWSDVDEKEKSSFIAKSKFHEVLSLTHMIQELNQWEDEAYSKFIKEKEDYINDLFNFLKQK